MMTTTTNSPCAACKTQRRRCLTSCVFAPYFPPDQQHKFNSVHKVFGASNVSKILAELPEDQRADTVSSLTYEAEARLRDPVYGCVGLIATLQQRLRDLQADLHSARLDLSQYIGSSAMLPIFPPPQPHLYTRLPGQPLPPLPKPSPLASTSASASVPSSRRGQGIVIHSNDNIPPPQQQQQQQQQQNLMMMQQQRYLAELKNQQEEMLRVAIEELQYQQAQEAIRRGREGNASLPVLNNGGSGGGLVNLLDSNGFNHYNNAAVVVGGGGGDYSHHDYTADSGGYSYIANNHHQQPEQPQLRHHVDDQSQINVQGGQVVFVQTPQQPEPQVQVQHQFIQMAGYAEKIEGDEATRTSLDKNEILHQPYHC